MVATVTGEMWWDYNANGVRDADEHPGYLNPGQVWADYNHDGARQEGETMVDDRATTAPTSSRSTRASSRRAAQGRRALPLRRATRTWTTEFDAVVRRARRRTACARSSVAPSRPTPDITFPTVGVAQLNGMIWDDKNDDGRREAGEDGVPTACASSSTTTATASPTRASRDRTRRNRSGRYILPIPTRYQVAGGELPPLVVERAAGRGLHGADGLRAVAACTRAPAR